MATDIKTPTTNTGFTSGGPTLKYRGKLYKQGALSFHLSLALEDSLTLRNPRERKARNCWTKSGFQNDFKK